MWTLPSLGWRSFEVSRAFRVGEEQNSLQEWSCGTSGWFLASPLVGMIKSVLQQRAVLGSLLQARAEGPAMA